MHVSLIRLSSICSFPPPHPSPSPSTPSKPQATSSPVCCHLPPRLSSCRRDCILPMLHEAQECLREADGKCRLKERSARCHQAFDASTEAWSWPWGACRQCLGQWLNLLVARRDPDVLTEASLKPRNPNLGFLEGLHVELVA